MLFNSLTYLVFLPLVALLYWLGPHRLRNALLLAASYVFYMSWMKAYGLLLLGLTAVNYLIGLLLARVAARRDKRLVFVAGLAVNLGCLALFKYTNLIIDAVGSISSVVSHAAGVRDLCSGWSELPIILPLGISFFVFEFIHYLVDVYKGAAPVGSPVRFGLFAAFFPSQIAGPIKRFQDFDQQLVKPKTFDKSLFNAGLALVLQGLFKKVVLGDNLAPIVQTGFSAPHLLGTLDAWACVVAFAWQIYFDFSGYTDIGRGSAMILGFTLPENFNLPYIATSLRDFWHRWHISLSTWLRDYLYIPLGGARKGKFSGALNSLITMLLGGLWHGAAWHYVLWGGYQGAGLALNRVVDEVVAGHPGLTAASKTVWWNAFSRVFTFLVVCVGWVLFRANNMQEAGAMYEAMFLPRASTTPEATIIELFFQSAFPVAIVLYMLTLGGAKVYQNHQSTLPVVLRQLSVPGYARAVGLLAFALLLVGLAPQKSIPFIYFQF